MPVEDNSGKLIGLVSSRLLLKHFTEKNRKLKLVKDIMIKKPITANPSTTIMEAMALMRKNKIGCLPVVQEQELIGIFTEMDFIGISSRLMERLSDQENQAEDDTD